MADGADQRDGQEAEAAVAAALRRPARGAVAGPASRRAHHRPRIGLRLATLLVLLFAGVGLAGLVLTGRTLHLPVWAVAEIEERLNRVIGPSHLPPGSALAIGAVEISVERDLVPRLVLRDIRLIGGRGESVLALPEVRTALSPGALLSGAIRPTSLRVTGARIAITRDAEGRIALQFGGLSGSPDLQSGAKVLDALDRMFSTDSLETLALIEADALALTLTDLRAGRSWEVGDGRLVIENGPEALAAELGMTLLDGATVAQASLSVRSDKADSSARLAATVERVAAVDLAAQAPPLAFLALVDAPISGRMQAELDATGALSVLEGDLTLAGGDLRLGPEDDGPVAFDHATLSLRYDPDRARITLDSVAVESASLRLRAAGTVDLLGPGGGPALAGMPEALIGQFDLRDVKIDPEGLFEEPVRFSSGRLDLRLTPDPLRIEVGQLVLVEGEERLVLSGEVAEAGDAVTGALDVSLNRIGTERMIRLWPVSVVPNTRRWLAENVGQGVLLDVNAALRLSPGRAPRFALDYEFADAEVRFVRTLPPVQDGHGHAAIEGNVYTIVLDGGHVTAPEGGEIDVSGSVMRVLDIAVFPAQAEVRLRTQGALTATLSLLDQEPFRFVQKAGRSVDLGEGRAILVSDLRFPLVEKLGPRDVFFDVSGRIRDFSSAALVPGQVVASPDLGVRVTSRGIVLEGDGRLGSLPVSARYEQEFGPEAGGAARVTGSASLTAERLAALGVGLPEGWFRGETTAEVTVALARGKPAELTLTSRLRGASLSIPALGWSKGAKTDGRIGVEAVLSDRPAITSIVLEAAGLEARGSITTRAGGGLETAEFRKLKVGDWLDASARITGKGKGAAVEVALTGGSLDLRRRPTGQAGGGGTGGRIAVELDRLVVSSGISLTGFSGAFSTRDGGLDGRFVAAVNGVGRIDGAAVPARGGTAVRITSGDAGRVMAAAGIFARGRGGTLDLTLQPSGPEGQYQGFASFADLSITGAPVLAEMLSAVSVVGLLEQMQGQGIVFNDGDVEFLMRPAGVEIQRGAAVGASLGVSFAGVYRAADGALDLRGTISPLFILNGLGQIFGRPGEGLFGFTYRLTGTAADPVVSVNPLSILTPGMFREIFRRPPPVLEGNG